MYFRPLGRNGNSQNVFGAQENRQPSNMQVMWPPPRWASRPYKTAWPRAFLQVALMSEGSFPYFPPTVWAFVKHKGYHTIDRREHTSYYGYLLVVIQAQPRISTRVLEKKLLCTEEQLACFYVLLFIIGSVNYATLYLTPAILVQCCALFIVTMSYDNDNLETHGLGS